jgi:hypothetical protein
MVLFADRVCVLDWNEVDGRAIRIAGSAARLARIAPLIPAGVNERASEHVMLSRSEEFVLSTTMWRAIHVIEVVMPFESSLSYPSPVDQSHHLRLPRIKA